MPSDHSVVFHDVTYRYDSATRPLFSHLTLHLQHGFTGVVGANGSGKTTLLQLATGQLTPEMGSVQFPVDIFYCPQRTDTPPRDLIALLESYDADSYALRGQLGVEDDFAIRWNSLSHGERKRAQIASALWRNPTLLAIDEPTNHIDAEARALLIRALENYRGVAMLVSHDREMLDALCTQCLWVDAAHTRLIPGGYSESSRQREADRETARHVHATVRKERDRLQREVIKRREASARSHRERSKSGLAHKDHDTRYKKNLARVTGKDAQAGRLLRQLDGRARRANARVHTTRIEKTQELGIAFEGKLSPRNTLFRLEPGVLSIGTQRQLAFPELSMRPDERVALTGSNGCGKTTLIYAILEQLNVPPEHLTVIPQEIEAIAGAAILTEARSLSPDRLGRVMNIVSRLGSRPNQLLESTNPSPGELRKLLLALGMSRAPHLLVLDEPTNHLDLPSIECLESALHDCPCGLLLVSHDERFLASLVKTRWEIAEGILTVVYRDQVDE